MPRIAPVDPAAASGKAKDLLAGVEKALGTTPNLMRTLAHSPSALAGYLGFGAALRGGRLGAALGEQIAVAVAGANRCDYCASAHTALGAAAGVDQAELAANLAGRAGDPKVQAALDFARAVVRNRGFVADADLAAVRRAGYDDGEIVEIVAAVAHNIFTNYFNHVAETEVDFPLVETDARAAA